MDAVVADEILSRAAEMRAGGVSWDRAADRLGTDAPEFRQLTREAGSAFRSVSPRGEKGSPRFAAG